MNTPDKIQAAKDWFNSHYCRSECAHYDTIMKALTHMESQPPSSPIQKAAEGMAEALRSLDEYFGIQSSLICNGCEHGFKPAKSCQNANCDAKKAHIAYEIIAALKSAPEEIVIGRGDLELVWNIVNGAITKLLNGNPLPTSYELNPALSILEAALKEGH